MGDGTGVRRRGPAGGGVDLVVPVKPLRRAKSRLVGAADGGAGDPVAHAALVTGLALDTVAAARSASRVRRVLVVTSDPELAATLRAEGVDVIPDTPAAGLNAALRHGAEVLGQRGDGRAGTVGALQADLPALRPAELDAAVDAAAGRRAFCPDRHGTGTTLLLAARGEPLRPSFGPGSAAAHAASGAVMLDGAWPSLRCDVDTAEDLAVAAELGLGPRSTALLGAACGASRPAP
ncbi:2-phospho-L-lactate guanylyltransferase [Gandjariella thermophila]|uniref:Phosphoenolpyruvate guanylyltransferase n=1 Tax=Gandjariella thermophila TaxID=1931992 RepID=A0A4D4JE04_9PSEU|nr:2-phospho-L-lactate guanylyltransferase [Gandjariella thermophila]GDY32606.1 2-phospho-L-lactate guanylyltransferase [Gandjariella thermophila]